MAEIWKAVQGYEGLYEVSNLGRVKSLKRLHTKERILAIEINHRGYARVNLWKFNKMKKFSVHRLVAIAFIENPESKTQVNHKDENKLNNCVDNLEWNTPLENHNCGTVNKRISTSLTNNLKKSKPVCAFDDAGNLVHRFPSIYEAGRQMGVSATSIRNCIYGRNRAKHCRGFVWAFEEKGDSNVG